MIRFKFLGFLLFTSFLCFGQEIVISGSAAGFEGKEIRIFTQNDPLSQKVSVGDLTTIDQTGNFRLSLKKDEIVEAWIAINRYTAPIYLEPGKVYNLGISSGDQTIMVNTWQQGELQYVFNNLDSTDVNVLIAQFDAAYFDFFSENASLIGSRQIRDKILEFEQTWTISLLASNSFIDTYVKYTLAQMKLSSGYSKKVLFDTYVKDKPWHLNNPVWFGFLDLFFAEYFNAFDNRFGGAAMHNRLSMGLTPDSLNKLFLTDDFLSDDDLRHLIVVKSAAESLYNNKYTNKPLSDLLHWITANANDEISQIAQSVLDNYQRRTKDFHIDALGLQFEKDSVLPWSGSDTLQTYLITTASWSSESKKEIELLKNLKEKYPDTFQVIQVELDDQNIESPFWQTTPVHPYDYLDQLGIYNIPHAVWIDKNGLVTRSVQTPKPSEGLESELFRIQSRISERNKIRIGQ